MRLPSEAHLKKWWLSLLFIATVLLCIYGAFLLLIKLLLPFTLAWIVAFFLQGAVRLLHRHTRFSKKWLGSVLILLLWVAIAVALFFALRALIAQLAALPAFLQYQKASMHHRLQARYLELRARFPFLSSGSLESDPLWQFLNRHLTNFFSQSGNSIWQTLRTWIAHLPSSFFSFLVFVMATFYFTADFTRLNGVLMERLPESVRQKIYACKRYFVRGGLSFLRAYLILLLITFLELLIGLSILKVPYSGAIALLVSVLDFFPVLGVGTVLVPWALFLLLFGNYSLGIGLLILFAIVTVIRQLIEPHIVGAQIGLSPLATLFATYLGYRLFGFLGLILAPLFLLLLLQAFQGQTQQKA
jgi:sporulation integral membrane protein YtvI